MKKVKIMLLSLILFAVIGGALAFKANLVEHFCTTDAYYTTIAVGQPKVYTCSYSFINGGIVTTTATCLQNSQIRVTINPNNPAIKPVCTTDEDPVNICLNTSCPVQESVIGND